MIQRLPVTGLSSFLGAAKMTVLNAILNGCERRRIAMSGDIGLWCAAMPRRTCPDGPAFWDRVRNVWAAGRDDHRQEIVSSWPTLDERAISATFDNCLVRAADPTAFGPIRHRGVRDTFKGWEMADAA